MHDSTGMAWAYAGLKSFLSRKSETREPQLQFLERISESMSSFAGLTIDSGVNTDLTQQKALIMLGAILAVEKMVNDESLFYTFTPRILQMTENMKKDLYSILNNSETYTRVAKSQETVYDVLARQHFKTYYQQTHTAKSIIDNPDFNAKLQPMVQEPSTPTNMSSNIKFD